MLHSLHLDRLAWTRLSLAGLFVNVLQDFGVVAS